MSTAPNKSERQACWDGRDAYWNCLEAKDEDKSKCQEERKLFEGNCSNTWIKYFDRRRDYLKFKAKLEAGQDPVKS